MMFFLSDEMPFSFDELLLFGAASGGKAIEDTATGNPLVFLTDLARPLKSLLIPFTPQQEGTGDPSPSNVRNIVPWDGLTVFGGGKNLLSDSAINYGSWGTDGSEIQNDSNKYRRLSVNLPAGNYVFSTDTTNCYIIRLLIDNTVVGTGGAIQSKNFTLTASANVKIAWRNTDTSEITGTLHNQIEVGQTATAYEPYTAPDIYPVTWSTSGTVYGGYVDLVTGELWATRPGKTLVWENGTNEAAIGEGYKRRRFALLQRNLQTGFANNICDKAHYGSSTTEQDAHFWVANFESGDTYAYIVLPNDTPDSEEITVVSTYSVPVLITTLAPQQITALVGNNTIWSDADGSMTAVFFKKG